MILRKYLFNTVYFFLSHARSTTFSNYLPVTNALLSDGHFQQYTLHYPNKQKQHSNSNLLLNGGKLLSHTLFPVVGFPTGCAVAVGAYQKFHRSGKESHPWPARRTPLSAVFNPSHYHATFGLWVTPPTRLLAVFLPLPSY